MGMYDDLIVNKDILPISDAEKELIKGNWQTKDLDCALTTAEITEDGRLKIRRFEHELVPKEERPYPNHDGLLGMIGALREVNSHYDYLDITDAVHFYADVQGQWYEFTAFFENGNLLKIVGGKRR